MIKIDHQNQPVLTGGVPVEQARAAMIMLHGRGATAQSILSLAVQFQQSDFAYLAPQADSNSWYPYRFLEPLERNEPGVSSALHVIGDLIFKLNQQKISTDMIMLLGFSQGACLILEYAVRHPQRYGGIVGLSGGLIGPPGTKWNKTGSLSGTQVFLGCSDVDYHIPKVRVEESAKVMRELKGEVDMRLYPGIGHTINDDEITTVRNMMNAVYQVKKNKEAQGPLNPL